MTEINFPNFRPLTAFSAPTLLAQCHCKAISTTVTPKEKLQLPIQVPLCHCPTCRHTTGLLCTAYLPIISPPSLETLAKTNAYPSLITTGESNSSLFSTAVKVSASACGRKGSQRRYFCTVCGCHAFRSWRLGDGDVHENGQISDDEEGHREWEVATGILDDAAATEYFQISSHINVPDTIDGGLAIFLPELDHDPSFIPLVSTPVTEAIHSEAYPHDDDFPITAQASGAEDATTTTTLPAYCACRTVSFHITRPQILSSPHSPFPDLMIPYHTHDPLIPNPQDEKWWLRGGGGDGGRPRRYLAGTCACRSCRLTSGHEIQTWAFVPRGNIFFHVPLSPLSPPPHPPHHSPQDYEGKKRDPDLDHNAGRSERENERLSDDNAETVTTTIIPLDFAILTETRQPSTSADTGTGNYASIDNTPPILKSYESSPNVMREFCATCGATVFWHDRYRPEIIDVSVSLLDAGGGGGAGNGAGSGARAEEWLEWWRRRVSFKEDAAARAGELVPRLERGLVEKGA